MNASLSWFINYNEAAALEEPIPLLHHHLLLKKEWN